MLPLFFWPFTVSLCNEQRLALLGIVHYTKSKREEKGERKNNSKGAKEMDLNQIEKYHDLGFMPDWAYYQVNGKSPMENYIEQHRKILDWVRKQQAFNPNYIHVVSEVRIKK